jgi:hypothetical protein
MEYLWMGYDVNIQKLGILYLSRRYPYDYRADSKVMKVDESKRGTLRKEKMSLKFRPNKHLKKAIEKAFVGWIGDDSKIWHEMLKDYDTRKKQRITDKQASANRHGS